MNYDTNQQILPPRVRKIKSVPPPEPFVSKRAKRKIAQLQRKESAKKQRVEASKTLEQCVISPDTSKTIFLIQELAQCQRKNKKFTTLYKELLLLNIRVPQWIQDRADQLSKLQISDLHGQTNASPDADELQSDDNNIPQAPISDGLSSEFDPRHSIKENCVAVSSLRVAENPKQIIYPDKPKRDWHCYLAPVFIRRPSAFSARLMLPATLMEQEIIENCTSCNNLLITGGTGCGKSTQVPQFLYESGFAMRFKDRKLKIGVIQPRRVAAISVCQRIQDEIGPPHRDLVTYQIRYQKSTCDESSCLKIMTDGILMQIIKTDFLLRDYSVIILDEAHERGINTDILLGLLSRISSLRLKMFEKHESDLPPLKLILMSATIRHCDFLDNPKLFPDKPSHIHIDTQPFEVVVHFNKETPEDFVQEAYKKIRQINRKLPAGSILVFLTGQKEIIDLALKLGSKRKLKNPNKVFIEDEDFGAEEELFSDHDEEDFENASECGSTEDYSTDEEKNGFTEPSKLSPEDESFSLGGCDTVTIRDTLTEEERNVDSLAPKGGQRGVEWLGSGERGGRLKVIPLFATGRDADRIAAFKQPESEERIVILATNVAETSITLPNIRYVVDCGFEKRRIYSSNGAVSSFDVVKISKANAKQRTGRAGRVGPGHCYRLYSSAVYEAEMTDYPPPKILEAPLDSTLLYIASLGLPDIRTFPFPTPPKPSAVQGAISRLQMFDMVDISGNIQTITDIGRLSVVFPILPRYSVCIIQAIMRARSSQNWSLILYVCLAVACLSIGPELFGQCQPTQWAHDSRDDIANYLLTVLTMVRMPLSLRITQAKKMAIVLTRYSELTALAYRLISIVHGQYLSKSEKSKLKFKFETIKCVDQSDKFRHLVDPSDLQWQSIRMCVCLGLIDRVAVRLTEYRPHCEINQLPEKEARRYRKAYTSSELNENVLTFIHASSRVFKCRPWPSVFAYNNLINLKGENKGYGLSDIIEISDPAEFHQRIAGKKITNNHILCRWLEAQKDKKFNEKFQQK